jgi:hypothetical protein
MRRIGVCTTALALLAACVPGASASTTATTPVAAVTLAACHPSDDVSQRFATFAGQMQTVKGSTRMGMRFTLLERLDTPDFEPVAVSDLRLWRRSKKGATSFIYSQRITALRDGGSYRMRVLFRWFGSDGRAVKTKTVRSTVCHQPARLPNLMISSITAKPGLLAGNTTYTVTVQNDGTGDAGGVDVALWVDGGTVANGQLAAVAAGKSASIDIAGPACHGFVRAAVDPGDRIVETNENDNTLVTACPS